MGFSGSSLWLRASIAVLVLVGVGLGVTWLTSLHERTHRYLPPASVKRIELDLGAANVEIVGASSGPISVERTDRFAFGHPPTERRVVSGSVLELASRCPRIILGTCSAAYRLTVPGDVTLSLRSSSGGIRLDGFHGPASIRTRSGDVRATAFCGGTLAATTGSGDVDVVTACAPEALSLHTTSGNVTALVPPGRYRVTARSPGGRRRVRDVTPRADAVFTIDVESRSGDVTVAGGV